MQKNCLFPFESNILNISHFINILLLIEIFIKNVLFCLFNVESLISSSVIAQIFRDVMNLLKKIECEKVSEICNIFLNPPPKKGLFFQIYPNISSINTKT